jgi:hypothetical protein
MYWLGPATSLFRPQMSRLLVGVAEQSLTTRASGKVWALPLPLAAFLAWD